MKTYISHRKYATQISATKAREVYELEVRNIPEKTYRKICRILASETDHAFDTLIDDTGPIG